jgi:peptide/nickel transport system substrate-binding protein
MRADRPSLRPRLIVGALLLVGLSACGRDDPRSAEPVSTVAVLYPADDGVVGPHWDEPAKFLVFLPLTTRNADGEIEGRLARSWTHSPDYRQWAVHLRSDVRWHDGVPVTADDIKFTLDLMRDPGGYNTPVVTVLDDSTYTFTVDRQVDGTPLDTWMVYYPKHLLETLDRDKLWEWEFWTNPVGNGPFRYARHMPKTMLELEANPDYYRGRPKVERVVLKFGTTPVPELLSGNVNAASRVGNSDLPKLQRASRLRIYHSIAPTQFKVVLWNHRTPSLGDPRVRRALTMAVDRRELHRLLNLPEGLPILDIFPTEEQFRRGELPDPVPFDPAGAARLLEAAGWTDTNGDGLREKDGQPLRLRLLAHHPGDDERAAVYLESRLRRIGVQAEIQTVDRSLGFERIRSGDYDAAITTAMTGQAWIFSHLGLLGEKSIQGHASPLGYANPQAIELVNRLWATVSPEEIDRLHRELAAITQRDLPVLILYPVATHAVADRRLRGLSSPWRADPARYMEDLWLEKR